LFAFLGAYTWVLARIDTYLVIVGALGLALTFTMWVISPSVLPELKEIKT
jgi:hypothetical protein